jgi:hypothetical protein
MKLKFKKLGPIDSGEIELNDLTIVAGENNTGKTYITYLIYCLLETMERMIEIDLKEIFTELRKKGTVKINLEDIVKQWPSISEHAINEFKKKLPEMLASKEKLFSKLTLEIDFPLKETWKQRDYKDELRSSDGRLLVSLMKPEKSTFLEFSAPESENLYPSFSRFIQEKILHLILDGTIPNVFIVSTERTGATTFRKQLNLATHKIIDLLRDEKSTSNPHALFESIYGKHEYAKPVRENVRLLNQLPNINTEEGPLFKTNPELLKQFELISGGAYVTNKDGITSFQPEGSDLNLGLGEVSSSVRSLLIIWYWVKYFAKKGDLLIIDEPELNLHPSNQRRLARFLAALVNNGIKIFITTHSDYIIKELNTLIMLNQESPKIEIILKELNDYNSHDKLDSSRVSVYMVRDKKSGGGKKSLIRADISPTLGIEAASFDETINDMNAVQDTIYYGLN